MNFRDGRRDESAEAALVVVAAGWVADTAHMNLGARGRRARLRAGTSRWISSCRPPRRTSSRPAT